MNYTISFQKDMSPFHQHKQYEIIIYTKGTGFLHCTGKDIPVSTGKIIIVPPGVSHRGTCGLDRFFIRGDFRYIFDFAVPTVVSDNAENEGIILAQMIYRNRYASPEYVAALINAFTHFLTQSLKTEDNIGIAIKDIVHKISNHFFEFNIDLKTLLEQSGYAEDYIRAQFKKHIGKTPTEFLTEVRIQHACYLIDTYENSLSLAEISAKCGYTDYVYFSKKFKSITGVSPRKYMEETFNY